MGEALLSEEEEEDTSRHMTGSIAEVLMNCRWALMDAETIQILSIHQRVRKLYILAEDGSTEIEEEFYPCRLYKDFVPKYKLSEFSLNNIIEIILYKGGTIEKELCEALGIASINIECFPNLEKNRFARAA